MTYNTRELLIDHKSHLNVIPKSASTPLKILKGNLKQIKNVLQIIHINSDILKYKDIRCSHMQIFNKNFIK
ncbi:hypothetical protein NBO_69g0009 [Nosema bombycis CQ1]|uniref:Uncharacterized protein n=1 Tax=Nosema bombycis (strain CQ1 / CVCC 102059) TaxID=578461 RepID=R0MHA5_NOSB1|nr:hypothetical protein NBO_69g0009 [Nosema bombycis CQ1]|eukprot:EOB13515.1 hypothetical protein NBO_69g0009 [Nosema bombycis CQ1]